MNGVTLVFDLDGTLIDTAPDLVHATNHVLASEGLAPVAADEILPWISFGARRMVEQGLAVHGVTRDSAALQSLLEKFLSYYAENIAVASRPYPRLLEVLDLMAGRGAKLAVCTNKREDLSKLLLGQLGLLDRFQALAGRDTYPVCKPHPEHLTRVIAAAGGQPDRAIMVGDSETDVLTARAAKIPIVGVSFGYTDVPMKDLNPDAMIDDYRDFGRVVEELLVRQLG